MQLEPRGITFGDLVVATMALLSRYWLIAVTVYGIFAVAMAGFEIWAMNAFPTDNPEALYSNGELLTIIVPSLFAIPVYYLLAERIMVMERLCDSGQPRRYGAMLGASIMTGIGVLIGFLFVIAPGFILMARWSIWAPLIIAQGRGASDSMQVSWAATSRSQGALAAMWLIVVFGYVGLTAAQVLVSGSWDEYPTLPGYDWNFVQEVGFGQVIDSAMSMLSMLISIAAYRLLVGSNSDLDAVFA